MMPTSTCRPSVISIGSSELKTRPSRYLLQGPDGLYLATAHGQTGIYATSDATAAHAFVDVDAAAGRAKALIANGVTVARITPLPDRF